MGHIVRQMPWGTIDLDTVENRVFFQQKWFYHWIVLPGASPWTYPEKRNFHNTLDRQIWASWSNRIVFDVRGSSRLARRFSRTGVTINFDVRWVLVNGHWDIHVRKLPPGQEYISNVIFSTRTVNLASVDLQPFEACLDDGTTCSPGFETVPHEFGHTLDNPDEYINSSPHYADTTSIMSIGGQLRSRHLSLIIAELNTMARGCTFTVRGQT